MNENITVGTIRLAGVGGPRDPTIARGTIRSLLKQLELAR
jgi:hypothetical protein